jgi:glycosyltransferase involved in cell wall biosynthesis
MISIILPFFNSEKYLLGAIDSVINQSTKDWELLLINDGATDHSKDIALSYSDKRIKYFEQENKGVSAARNVGLANMNGDYFCFLDADDIFPVNSLEARFNLLSENKSLRFMDGTVKRFDQNMDQVLETWQPQYFGDPLVDLVSLTGKSFLGLTWMIRRDKETEYQFCENMTHVEDLLFFMELARTEGSYSFTKETILHYRDTPNSAMKNLEGLETGYRYVESQIRNWKEVSRTDLNVFKFKYRKAMFLAYIRKLKINKAIKAIF